MVCLQARIVPMEEDALWRLPGMSHISATDGTGTNKSDEEVRLLGYVLRGRRDDCDTNPAEPKRAARLCTGMHEKFVTEM